MKRVRTIVSCQQDHNRGRAIDLRSICYLSGMNSSYILSGGNQGDRLANLAQAREEVEKLGRLTNISGIYETAAWGNTDQPDFLNQVMLLETDLQAPALMKALLLIEQRMGRVRHEKNGPRTIDLDILYFNTEILDTAELQVPHPRLEFRRFVLEPLYEVAPRFVHPGLGKTTYELLLHCPDPLLVKRLDIVQSVRY